VQSSFINSRLLYVTVGCLLEVRLCLGYNGMFHKQRGSGMERRRMCPIRDYICLFSFKLMLRFFGPNPDFVHKGKIFIAFMPIKVRILSSEKRKLHHIFPI